MNEPKLRFKKDDGSQFPDWEEKKLGDITEKVVRKDENSTADVRMISQGNGFILQSDKYSKENAGQSLKKYTLLKRDEFAYNHGASKVKPYGVCYRLCESDEARVPYVYHTFKLIDDDSNFWNYALNTSYMDRQLKKMVSSGARMDGLLNIGYDTYMSINVHTPSLPEQQKIASLFTELDNLIQSAEKELEGYRELKKGMLQKMFPKKGETVPEIRFPEFSGEWEQCKLGELSEKTFGGGTPKTSNESFWKGNIPWIQSSDLTEGSLFDVEPRKYISQEAVDKSATKLVPENSVAIVTRVGVGKLVFMPFSYATSQDFLSLSVLKTEPKFTVYALYKKLQSELNAVQGTSIKGVTKDELLAKKVMIPCYKEQEKIGSYLHSFDHLITLQQKELDGYKELKKGLLQQMFC